MLTSEVAVGTSIGALCGATTLVVASLLERGTWLDPFGVAVGIVMCHCVLVASSTAATPPTVTEMTGSSVVPTIVAESSRIVSPLVGLTTLTTGGVPSSATTIGSVKVSYPPRASQTSAMMSYDPRAA